MFKCGNVSHGSVEFSSKINQSDLYKYFVAMQYYFIMPVTTIWPNEAATHVTQVKRPTPANTCLIYAERFT